MIITALQRQAREKRLASGQTLETSIVLIRITMISILRGQGRN